MLLLFFFHCLFSCLFTLLILFYFKVCMTNLSTLLYDAEQKNPFCHRYPRATLESSKKYNPSTLKFSFLIFGLHISFILTQLIFIFLKSGWFLIVQEMGGWRYDWCWSIWSISSNWKTNQRYVNHHFCSTAVPLFIFLIFGVSINASYLPEKPLTVGLQGRTKTKMFGPVNP